MSATKANCKYVGSIAILFPKHIKKIFIRFLIIKLI